MTLAQAFSAEWKKLKAVATTVATFVTKNSATIQTVVGDVGTAVDAVDPAAAPVVTELDSLEEVVMGKIAAAATDASQTASLQTLFGDAWPTVEALVAALKTSPTVTSVTAALKAS